jgi:hypothetical protein
MNLVQNFKANNGASETIDLSWDRPVDDNYNQLIPITVLSVIGYDVNISQSVDVEFGYYVIQGLNRLLVNLRGQNISSIQVANPGSLAPGPAYLQVTTDVIVQRRKDAFPVELDTGTVYTQNVAVEIFNANDIFGSGNASVVDGKNIFTDANADFTDDIIGRIFRDSSSFNFIVEAVLSPTELQLQSNDTLHNGVYVILSDFPQTNQPQVSPKNYLQITSAAGVINDPNGFLIDSATGAYAVPHQLANRIVMDANSVSYLILDNTVTQLILATTSTPFVGIYPAYNILQTFNGINTQFFYVDDFVNSVQAAARLGTGLEPDQWYYYTAFTKNKAIGPAGENFATFDNASSTQAYALSTGTSDFGNLLYNNFWPLVYRETDSDIDASGKPAASGTGNLQDLMSIFGTQFDELYSLIKTFNLQDPTTIALPALNQFSYQLDLAPTDSIIGIDTLRRVGEEMIDVYKNKGDKIGIYKYVRIITTWDITGGNGDINAAIIDTVPNINALRLYSSALGLLNTRLYGSLVIVAEFNFTNYDITSGVVSVPTTVDLSTVQVGDYLDINSTLYAILGGITVDPVPNGTILFDNPIPLSYMYNIVTGVVQYTGLPDLTPVSAGDIFFDGAGNKFVILAVNAPGHNITIAPGQIVNNTPSPGGGGSIQQGEKRFVLNTGLPITPGPATIVRATPEVNIVPSFTPSAYNSMTGFLSVPDGVNLQNVKMNDTFVDADNDSFTILGGINNSNGHKGFQININQIVSLSSGAVINRIDQQGSGRFLKQLPGVVIPGFFTFREYIVLVPGIAMFEIILAGITINMQNQATITFSGTQNFGRVNGLVGCIYYPNQSNVQEYFEIISNTSNTITLNGVPQFATVGNTGIILTPLNSNRFQRISNLIYKVSPYNTKAGFDFIDPINVPI